MLLNGCHLKGDDAGTGKRHRVIGNLALPFRLWSMLVLLAAAAGGLNMILRVRGMLAGADFRLFWLAGRVWGAGHDPYGPAYREAGLNLFGAWSPTMTWLYPPHILPIAVLYALLPADVALLAWNLTGLILAVASVALLAILFARSARQRLMIGAAMIAYLGLMTASGSALEVGQIGFVLLFGIALIAVGIARERPVIGALGMMLVMLKPQVGIVLCCAVPFLRHGTKMSLYAVAVVVVTSMPALVIGKGSPTLAGFLYNVTHYRNISYNLPQSMTGVANLLWAITGREMPAIPMSLAACAFGLVTLFLLNARVPVRSLAPRDQAMFYIFLSLGAMAGFVMLHIYDLVVLVPLVAIIPILGRSGPALAFPLALFLRPENVGRLFAMDGPPIAAIGGVLIILICIVVALRIPSYRHGVPAH